MLKVLKSKDCKKPKTKKCAKALTKYAKKRYSKNEEVIKKETIDIKAGSNNKIQVGTGNKMGSTRTQTKKTPTGILNSLGGTYKTISTLPQFNHSNPFSQNTGLSTPTLGYNATTSNRWFAPMPPPTMTGTTTRFPTQPNYNSLYARLTALETKGKSTSTSTSTGSNFGQTFSGQKENLTPIKDSDGNITGYKKPRGSAPRDTLNRPMKWNKTNPDANELWKNPESNSESDISRGWVTATNDADYVWNEDTAKYEEPPDDDPSGSGDGGSRGSD